MDREEWSYIRGTPVPGTTRTNNGIWLVDHVPSCVYKKFTHSLHRGRGLTLETREPLVQNNDTLGGTGGVLRHLFTYRLLTCVRTIPPHSRPCKNDLPDTGKRIIPCVDPFWPKQPSLNREHVTLKQCTHRGNRTVHFLDQSWTSPRRRFTWSDENGMKVGTRSLKCDIGSFDRFKS